MGILAGDKFKPTLFVGLGGHGGRTVNLLAGRLRRHPSWDRIAALTHFLVIDTNKNDLDSQRDIRPDCRFLLSNFDAVSWLRRKRGELELPADPLVTQWVPDGYIPRSGMSPGAGQIRLESRIKLYYNLEEDRAGIRRKCIDLFDQMWARDNAWRDNEDRVIRVLVYASVAGGTGSGGFLPMAWLLRQWVEDHGSARPSVTSFLTLPTTFLSKVRRELHKDIAANGYAALKELEYTTRQLAYDGGVGRMEFHYEPGTLDRSRQFVEDRPFALSYLIDRPDQISIEKYEHALADASYLQLFSPLLGAQASEYDNYEKHQRQLALGHFSVHYGAFGTALLQLPRRDILRYSGLRYAARALREYLSFGSDHPDFRVPWGDPAFERLAPEEKNRRVDAGFEGYVGWRARQEEAADERGVFSAIAALTGKGGKDLKRAMGEKLAEIYGRLTEIIDIPDVDRPSINPGSPTVKRALAVLRRAHADSRTKVRVALEAELAELRAGRFFGAFFSTWEVNPIAQRLLLIRLLAGGFILPALGGDGAAEDEAAAEDLSFLTEPSAGVDLDGEHVSAEVGRLDTELARTASQGFLGRITDSENKAFAAAKQRAIRVIEDYSEDCRTDLRRMFWRTFEGALREVAETLLSSFRKVAEVSHEAARLAEDETERFRRDPGAWADSDVARYYLDAEVLRDDRRRERLWGALYSHLLDRGAFFDSKRIFEAVTQSFQPARDPDGTLRARDAAEIVATVRTTLLGLSTEVYSRALDDAGLNLARGLDLEQRYIHLLDAGQDLDELRKKNRLDDAVRAVPAEAVQRGVEDKLKRLSEECVLLAQIDATRRDDPTVVPASVFYAGLDARFDTDESTSLGGLLRGVVANLNLVPGWTDPDSLVLYKALLGVPVYWWRNVSGELAPAYQSVRADPRRAYPLHIEAAWESDPGLPDLDPVQIRRAEEARRATEAAVALASSRATKVGDFAMAVLAGAVVDGPGGLSWSMDGATSRLGGSRVEAFNAFISLDPDLRRDLVGIGQRYMAASATRAGRERIREELSAGAGRLRAAYAAALAGDREVEARFLKEERAAVEALLATLAD